MALRLYWRLQRERLRMSDLWRRRLAFAEEVPVCDASAPQECQVRASYKSVK